MFDGVGAGLLAMVAALGVASTAHAQPGGELLTDDSKILLGSRQGDPAADLPAGTILVSSFGERPAFSPDGRKLAFVGQSYGDVFEYDLRTGAVRNLTAHMPHKGFLRVHYLHDGSYLLLGPHQPAATREDTRFGRIELWWMDARASRPAQRLGATVSEGIAVSRGQNRIAWAELPPGQTGVKAFSSATTTMKTADVVVTSGRARLMNVQTVMTSADVPGCPFEAQDFLPGDGGMTFPCYGRPMRVMSIDFASRQTTVYPTPPHLFAEVEGIFPDGQHTLVECSGAFEAGMDLCVLELKAGRPAYRRITRIMDYGRWKYGNPVASPDGRMMAASIGTAAESAADAGAAQGIVLMRLPAGF